jgi:hypothetical protein
MSDRTVWRLFVALVFSFGADSVHAQHVVEDASLQPTEILAEVPLVGHRAFPQNALVLVDRKKNEWAIDASILYAAAVQDSDLVNSVGMDTSQIMGLELPDLLALYRKVGSNRMQQGSCTYERPDPAVCRQSMVVRLGQDSEFAGQSVDAALVRSAVSDWSSGSVVALNDDGLKKGRVGFRVDPRFGEYTHELYASLLAASTMAKSGNTAQSAFELARLTKIASMNAHLAAASAVPLTKIAIGTPLHFPAAEKKLNVERSIAKQRDIYWVQFAINPKEDLRKSVTEIAFFVTLKTKGAQAFELAPLRYGHEHEIKEERKTPEVKVETPQGGVSIGTFYGQEISYKSLKPTIVGTGLQSAEFGWVMYDEMMDMSAKRFIAIVGVPKNTKKLEFEMVVTARPSAVFSFFPVQEQFSASQPMLHAIELRSSSQFRP